MSPLVSKISYTAVVRSDLCMIKILNANIGLVLTELINTMLIITNSVINRVINKSNITVTIWPLILLNKFKVFKKTCQIKSYTNKNCNLCSLQFDSYSEPLLRKIFEFDFYYIWSIWTKTKSAWQLWVWTLNIDFH